MSDYSAILSPIRINNTYLKNHISFPNAPVHFLQGPETFPAEGFIAFHAGLARAGASYITMGEWNNPNQRNEGMEDSRHMPYFDIDDPSVKNYLSQLADDIHFYGSKLCVGIKLTYPEGYSLNGGKGMNIPGHKIGPTEPLPVEMMDEVIDAYVARVAAYKDLGYDMVSVQLGLGDGKFSMRTDEYDGSSVENSTRFMLRVCKRIKEVLGRDFLIETTVYGERPGSYTIDDVAEAAKLAEGLVDIFTIREKDLALSHPTGYTFDKGQHGTIEYAKVIKKTGAKVLVAVNGGFQDLDECNGYIEAGYCDIISMGRGLFAEPELEKKAREGRGEDVTPCIWCNKCHGTMTGPWLTFCSVNPTAGIAHRTHRMIDPLGEAKRVAVIGGGPIGMRAAIYAAERGHEVTLFEKTDVLGGQLLHSDHVRFKWPLRDLKNHLILQTEKHGVTVKMNCAPSPDEISAMGFDAVIAATGATPFVPDIKGARAADGSLNDGLWTCLDVFGNEDKLGHRVVIVGASETGTETGIHLAQHGHEVYALTRRGEIAADASKLHGITMSWIEYNANANNALDFRPRPEWDKYENFHGITGATTVEVGENFVRYIDSAGKEQTIECDSVIISGGMTPNIAEALSYSGSAKSFHAVGDCSNGKNLQVGMRQAYSAANRI